MQNFRVYFSRTAWIFGFLCGKCAKITTSPGNYLVSVYTSKYSIFGVAYDLILVLRSHFFEYLCETLYKHASEHLEAADPENKWVFFSLPTVNAYLLSTSLKVCDWSGHTFGASTSPRSLTKDLLYVTLFHCSWRSA